MPYREFDDDGGVWIIFSTQPRSGANVRPQYADGWLSFQRGAERRRLSPIPPNWENAGDDQLRSWLRSSELVAKSAEDDEALGASPERGDGRPDGREDPGAGDVAGAAEPVPGAGKPVGEAGRVQRSLERIREMLSGIRGDLG